MEIGEPATPEAQPQAQASEGDAGQTETPAATPAEEKKTFSFDDIEF